jgi:hypothetical protein
VVTVRRGNGSGRATDTALETPREGTS